MGKNLIYVDELKEYDWVVRGKETASCHMFADGNLEELHAFANKIGLKREWLHDSRHPHYDLTPSKRKLAVEFGAIEITTKEWLRNKILNKLDEEAFASGGIIYPNSASTFVGDQVCSLTMKDIEKAWKKMNESIPPDPYSEYTYRFVNPGDVESLLPGATNIKRDEQGKVVSFNWYGAKFKVTQYCPKNSIILTNPKLLDLKIEKD